MFFTGIPRLVCPNIRSISRGFEQVFRTVTRMVFHEAVGPFVLLRRRGPLISRARGSPVPEDTATRHADPGSATGPGKPVFHNPENPGPRHSRARKHQIQPAYPEKRGSDKPRKKTKNVVRQNCGLSRQKFLKNRISLSWNTVDPHRHYQRWSKLWLTFPAKPRTPENRSCSQNGKNYGSLLGKNWPNHVTAKLWRFWQHDSPGCGVWQEK